MFVKSVVADVKICNEQSSTGTDFTRGRIGLTDAFLEQFPSECTKKPLHIRNGRLFPVVVHKSNHAH